MPDTAVIVLYEDIGGHGNNAQAVREVLKNLSPNAPVDVRINSAGGDAFEGIAIHDLLRSHGGRVTTYGDGLVASIAGVIFMAGDHRILAENAWMMMHNPVMATTGSAKHLRKSADAVDNVGSTIGRILVARTGRPEDEIREMLNDETWLDAHQAVELGFADAVAEPFKIAAHFDLSRFKRVPAPVRGLFGADSAALQSSEKDVTMTKPETASAAEVQPNPALIADRPQDAAELRFNARVEAIKGAYRAGLNLDMQTETQKMIDDGVDPATVPEILIEAHARRAQQAAGAHSLAPSGGGLNSGADNSMTDIGDAILGKLGGNHRSDNPLAARPIVAVLETGLQRRGFNTTTMTQDEIINAAFPGGGLIRNEGGISPGHTTSDLPGLFGNAINKTFRGAWMVARSPLTQMAARSDRQNFHVGYTGTISEPPTYLKILEAGEVLSGAVAEAVESWMLATYGRKLAFTRQLLFNDQLGVLGTVLRQLGGGAAAKEADLLFDQLAANSYAGATMDDGVEVFDAAHGNLAGSGAAIDTTTLGAAIAAMRQQKGPGGEHYIAVQPKYLLVGPTNEVKARQAVGQVNADAVGNVNPFAGVLEVLVEPRFAARTDWYVFSDPAVAPVLEYGYLSGNEGPQIATREGWDVLGQEMRVIFDVGAGVIDFRGGYRNAGS